MIVSLKIPDEVYEAYGRRNPENPRAELELTLQAFEALDPRKAGLVLDAEELKELNTLLGHPISSTRELLEHVGRSQKVSFGEGLAIPLDTGQRQRLAAQADFFQQPFEDFAQTQIRAALARL